MKKDNIFWGVLLLLAAVYILAHSLGFTPDISLMRIVIGIICVMCFINSPGIWRNAVFTGDSAYHV